MILLAFPYLNEFGIEGQEGEGYYQEWKYPTLMDDPSDRDYLRYHRDVTAQPRLHRPEPTRAENALWQRLRHRALGGLKFRRQHPIGPFIADFYCLSARLVIEIDGGIHHTFAQAEHDRLRDEAMHVHRFRVLRFTNDEIVAANSYESRISANGRAELWEVKMASIRGRDDDGIR